MRGLCGCDVRIIRASWWLRHIIYKEKGSESFSVCPSIFTCVIQGPNFMSKMVRIYSITRSMLVVDCRDAPRFNLVGFSGSNIRDGVFSIEAITRIGATHNQYSL